MRFVFQDVLLDTLGDGTPIGRIERIFTVVAVYSATQRCWPYRCIPAMLLAIVRKNPLKA